MKFKESKKETAEVKTHKELAMDENGNPVEVDVPDTPEEPKKKEHPRWEAFKAGAKKVVKPLGIGVLIGGAIGAAIAKSTSKGAEGDDNDLNMYDFGPEDDIPEDLDQVDGNSVDEDNSIE